MRAPWSILIAGLALGFGPLPALAESRTAANDRLLQRIQAVHALSEAQVESLRVLFGRSSMLGQGNPAITRHPASEAECVAKLETMGVDYLDPTFERICGHPYMAPLYDPRTQDLEDATVCIDQFEFPNIPCVFPVVWVRAREAVRICEIMGKRLCDAHEWEGSCAGALEPPDYRFDLAAGKIPSMAIGLMRQEHNREYRLRRSWGYGGSGHRAGICATGSQKSPGCTGGSWSECGSNTYPCGFFPDCVSPLKVYDLHGNAAEHMNLPLEPGQMASRGSRTYGFTEMKGSWFVFDAFYAHDDWCRWRAPFWHGSRVMDPASHRNYHLGFRCCDDVVQPGQ